MKALPSFSRRRVLGSLLATAFVPRLGAQDAKTDYAKDVEFLLAELEKQAGHFFAIKGVDWKAVAEKFRREVAEVKDDVAHVKLCGRLVARLHDGHAGLVDLKVTMPDESKGRSFAGPHVKLVEIGERVFVRECRGGSQLEGLVRGVEVVAIDGVPIREWIDRTVVRMSEDHGFSTNQMARFFACHAGLADWAGTKIEFTALIDGARKVISETREGGSNYVPEGPVSPPRGIKEIGSQVYGKTPEGFGYMHVWKVPGNLPEQLDKVLEALGDIKGFILDTRANGGGGCDHAAVFGRFVPVGKIWRQYTSAGAKPFGGPMVVIVDAGVRSAGETIAGQFKEDGRALMIGDSATAGMSAQKTKIAVPSGLFGVYFAIASNKQRFNEGRGIEGLGVSPHEITPYDAEDLLKDRDTQIRRATEFLTHGFPNGKVAWPA